MLTVCVPIYNEEENVTRIVRNIQDNSLWKESEKKEIILCINGSTDDSSNIAVELSKNDSKIRVIITPKKSKNHAWELLRDASHPRSSILFYVDADVLLGKNTLRDLNSELIDCPHLVIVSARATPLKDQSNNWHQRVIATQLERELDQYNQLRLMGACYAIRRANALRVKMPEDPRISDDSFLEAKFWNRFEVKQGVIVHYRVATFLDYLSQRIRWKTSSTLLNKKYPELAQKIRLRKKIEKNSKGGNLEQIHSVGLLQWLFTILLYNLFSPWVVWQSNESIKRGIDTWKKVKSTKKFSIENGLI